MKKIYFFFIVLLTITSCKTNKQIVYLQNSGNPISLNDSVASPIPDARLKVGDLLTITVNATTSEAAQPFNLPLIPQTGMESYVQGNASANGSGGSLQNYLIDTNGNIMFPILGKIEVAGLSKNELSETIYSKIYPRYIKEEPIITIRYANFKVSVLGEVNSPGVLKIDNEMVSIFEAIAMAGDLSIYGKRDNVLLIRENDGKRVSVRIDLRDKRLIDSPYYYLQQNDILYIQPNNPKSRSSALSTAETISISVIGTLISLTSLLVNLLR
ncbi:MAG: polysaccharide biosynthesis/export family protein [Paludibacter sp.]|nr:polysaccharide biosynthesis/export family protein [Paludibacter sp.]